LSAAVAAAAAFGPCFLAWANSAFRWAGGNRAHSLYAASAIPIVPLGRTGTILADSRLPSARKGSAPSSQIRYNRPRPEPDPEVCMSVETASYFSQVIEDHVELKRRNSSIENTLPIDRYLNGDPFENHPLFKTEEQARLEETMGGEEPAVVAYIKPVPGEERLDEDDSLWGRTRDFDWGD
jgi:hypothetical protein